MPGYIDVLTDPSQTPPEPGRANLRAGSIQWNADGVELIFSSRRKIQVSLQGRVTLQLSRWRRFHERSWLKRLLNLAHTHTDLLNAELRSARERVRLTAPVLPSHDASDLPVLNSPGLGLSSTALHTVLTHLVAGGAEIAQGVDGEPQTLPTSPPPYKKLPKRARQALKKLKDSSTGSLWLSYSDIDDALLARLVTRPELSRLYSLMLDGNPITEPFPVGQLARLSILNLRQNPISDGSFLRLLHTATFSLNSLNISNTPLTASALSHLAESAYMNDLATLHLNKLPVDRRVLEHIADAQERAFETPLQTLGLNDCPHPHDVADVFVERASMRHVLHLELTHCKLSDDALEHLCQSPHARFRELKLSRNKTLTDRALELLGQVSWPLNNLQLSGCHFTTQGLRALLKGAFVSKLQRLELSLNRLDAEAITLIEDATHMSSLRALDIRRNPGLDPKEAKARLEKAPHLAQCYISVGS